MAIRYINISLHDLKEGKRIPFAIYAQPRGSNTFVLYSKKGKVLKKSMYEKMKQRKNFTFYIDANEIERYRNYLFDIVQKEDKPKARARAMQRVHDALALEEAVEHEKRQPEFGKFPFAWWALGTVLIAIFFSRSGWTIPTAIAVGALGGFIMTLILLYLALAPDAEERNGKSKKSKVTCPKCHKSVSPPPLVCRYCGTEIFTGGDHEHAQKTSTASKNGQQVIAPELQEAQNGQASQAAPTPPQQPITQRQRPQRSSAPTAAERAAARAEASRATPAAAPAGTTGIAAGGIGPI